MCVLIFMQCHEVAVVGGGPSGAYCAYNLSRRGVDTLVFDHSHPREKACGGGISTSVIEKFPFVKMFLKKGGISTKLKIISPTGKQVVETWLERGFNISRQIFDQEILTMSTNNGAKLVIEKVIGVQRGSGFWKIKTTKSLFSAKILVGADGVNSLVRRKTVGAISGEDLALTFGYFVTGVEKAYSVVKFLDDLQSYIWIFPRQDQASLGIGGALEDGRLLKELLDNFKHSYCPTVKINSTFAALLPSPKSPEFFANPCAGEDWVLVGDAAGHADPITGEGILYALWSGKLAADAIAKKDLNLYDPLWRKEYGNYLEERCRMKDTFYNPLTIELSLAIGCLNKTYFCIK